MAAQTRRTFLKETSITVAGTAALQFSAIGASARNSPRPGQPPWYRRVVRWGQTNITEIDPERYDVHWWRKYWKRTHTQGIIVNAGGIVAYYPSQVPFHAPAKYLNGRDLFGELCHAAHEEGLAVFARMDSNRAHKELYDAHPDWFAIGADAKPYRAGELFITCVNSPYYEEHIPAILREIAARYSPDGFTDNSWSGLGRGSPCFCSYCQERFKARTGSAIPREKNWNDPLYREWILWNYERRIQLWEANNRVTREAGGPHCIWSGMNSGSISGQSQTFRDYREICRRAEIIMLDHQSRSDASGFQHNGEAGKLIHGLLGWDKLIPESMAMYQAGRPTFRLSSKPTAEARMWMLDGIAGGLQPWWHHVGAYHEDRRMYRTAEPVYRWHEENQQYLLNRQPVATVGIVWSQRNFDFYGRDESDVLCELPWRGVTQALIRGRIPYLPVHADDLDRIAASFSVLVLPNLAAMSNAQVESVRRFVASGGGLLATGQTSLFAESGEPRADFALASLFGVHVKGEARSLDPVQRTRWATDTAHTYLRLAPELRANVDGPHTNDEPRAAGGRHPVLRGFEETDILPFGGVLEPLQVDPGSEVLATFIPSFPIYPPETAWMREPVTNVPGLILRDSAPTGRVAFLPADIDRRFGRDNLPDHGDLLANLVRWVARDTIPLRITGTGLLDCHLYQQPGRLILHIVNLTSAATWRQPIHELIPVGPLRISVQSPASLRLRTARLFASKSTARLHTANSWSTFEIRSILDHELVVLS